MWLGTGPHFLLSLPLSLCGVGEEGVGGWGEIPAGEVYVYVYVCVCVGSYVCACVHSHVGCCPCRLPKGVWRERGGRVTERERERRREG
jgi:hypothetical protein